MSYITNHDNFANQAGVQNVAGDIINNIHLHRETNASSVNGPQHDCDVYDRDLLKSLAFPSMLDRRSDIEQPHDGTCEWICELSQYRDWRSATCGLLWIKGHPGTGKSTLMSYLYQVLIRDNAKSNDVILSFFCSARGTELQHSMYGIFRSLLNQLYSQVRTIRPVVRDVFLSKHKAFGYDLTLWSWKESEVKDLFTRALMLADCDIQFTIFIDALDELGEINSCSMAKYFHMLNDKIAQDSRRVKLCISSRHYPVVSVIPGIEVYMEDNNRKDIQTFIDDYLDSNVLAAYNQNKGDAQSLKLALLDRASGIFQWVRLVIPMIEKFLLDGDSIADVHIWMTQIPTELGDMYEQMIRKVLHHKTFTQTCRLFQWVLFARRPLTLCELRYALVTSTSLERPEIVSAEEVSDFIDSDARMERKVKSLSGGLLQVVQAARTTRGLTNKHKNNAIVQVIHQSVYDYFINSGLRLLILSGIDDALPSRYHGDMKAQENLLRYCHLNLHKCCLNYITQVSKSLSHSDSTFTNWNLYPLLQYSILNLFVHASLAASFPNDELEDLVQRLQELFEFWKWLHRATVPRLSSPRIQIATTLLHVAAIADLTDVAKSLIRQGVDVNKKASALSPIHLAARYGHLNTAKILYHAGANLQATNDEKVGSPLAYALHGQHQDFVHWLLHQDVQSDKEIRALLSASLNAAVSDSEVAVVEILLKRGIEADEHYFHRRWELANPLRMVVEMNRADFVKILIDRGADPDIPYRDPRSQRQKSVESHSLLEWVVQNEEVEMAYYGRQNNVESLSLLEWAVRNAKVEVARALLNAGASVKNLSALTEALRRIAAADNHVDMVAMLVKSSNIISRDGSELNIALRAAAQTGNLITLKMLLNAGADVNSELAHHYSVLENAITSCSVEMVTRVLKAGATSSITKFIFRSSHDIKYRDHSPISLYNSKEVYSYSHGHTLKAPRITKVELNTLDTTRISKIIQLLRNIHLKNADSEAIKAMISGIYSPLSDKYPEIYILPI